MQEFSSISVSSYEAGSLADRLTEQSRDGWDVVAIVPTGSTITAYLSREGDGDAATSVADEPAEVITPVEPDVATEPEPTFATVIAPEPASQPDEPADEPLVADITPTAAETTHAAGVTEDAAADTAAAETTTTAAAGAAPAGWYADPSGRFELRYWDGGQWTEHVSRAGQQYTDPPVA